MATTFSLSADCKTMEIHGAPASASFTLYHNEFTSPTQLYQLEDPTAPYNGTIDPNDGQPINGYLATNPATLDGSGSIILTYENIGSAGEAALNGIWMLVINDPVDPTITYTYGAIGHCDIDCCIANKLDELIICSCDKDCSAALDTISKIYLLIQGASTNVLDCLQTPEQYQRAYEKYLKAKSMCSTQECNCSC